MAFDPVLPLPSGPRRAWALEGDPQVEANPVVAALAPYHGRLQRGEAPHVRREEVQQLFDAIDLDGDGVASRAELRRRLLGGELPPQLRQALETALATAPSDRGIGVEELRQGLLLGTEDSAKLLVRRACGGKELQRSRLVAHLAAKHEVAEACYSLPLAALRCIVFTIVALEHLRAEAGNGLARAVERSLGQPALREYPGSFWTWAQGRAAGTGLVPGVTAVGGERLALGGSPELERHWLHWPLEDAAAALAPVQGAWQAKATSQLGLQLLAQSTAGELYAYHTMVQRVHASGLPEADVSTLAFDAQPVWLDAGRDWREGGVRSLVLVLDVVFLVLCSPVVEFGRFAWCCWRSGIQRGLRAYVTVWTGASWLSMCICTALAFAYIRCEQLTRGLNELLGQLPALNEGLRYNTTSFELAVGGLAAYEEQLDRLLEKGASAAGAWRDLRGFAAVMGVCLLLQLAQALCANPRLRTIARALLSAAVDLAHILVVFLAVLLAFALTGHMIYGRSVQSFSTAASAVAHTLLILRGRGHGGSFAELHGTGGALGAVWLWLLGVLLRVLALRLILAAVLSAYLQARLEAEGTTTIWRQACDAFTERRRATKAVLAQAEAPHEAARRQAEAAVRLWSEHRVYEKLRDPAVHPEEAVSSASLAEALGAEGWAEKARLANLLRGAGSDDFVVSPADAARLTDRLDTNVQELAHALRGASELLAGSRAPQAAAQAKEAEEAVPPPAAETLGSQEPSAPEAPPPALPSLRLPGVPEGEEESRTPSPSDPGPLRAREAEAQGRGVLQELTPVRKEVRREVLTAAHEEQIVSGNWPLCEEQTVAVSRPAHEEQIVAENCTGEDPSVGEDANVAFRLDPDFVEGAAREVQQRLEELEEWRCVQLEDYVARLVQGIDHLERCRGRVAEERLQALERLEQSLDDLFVRIRPALGEQRSR